MRSNLKIVIIGAASGFGGRLSMDILACPALRDSHIALCDIHAENLDHTRQYLQRFVTHHRLPATLSASVDFRKLLPDADFVVFSVSVGGPSYWGEPFCSEISIPRRYGIEHRWADTLGPGGVFRFLRTAPVQLDFCKAMERHCPDAIVFNYTNPMSMLTWVHSTASSIRNVGLCHSVQGTTKKLARVAGVPYEDVTFRVAGINHLAWVLSIRHGGKDLYPTIRESLYTHEEFADDRVRVELMKHFGYFPTESSAHNAEYVPYFRRTPELRAQYGLPDCKLEKHWDPPREWIKDSGIDPAADTGSNVPPLQKSHEYAAGIIEAYAENKPLLFWGNMMNDGLILNLPSASCVEVPCVADGEGIHPCRVGALPSACAALDLTNINVQQLAVEAFLTRNREAAFQAIALDPLTASVLTLPRIREMFDELWEADKTFLTYFDA